MQRIEIIKVISVDTNIKKSGFSTPERLHARESGRRAVNAAAIGRRTIEIYYWSKV